MSSRTVPPKDKLLELARIHLNYAPNVSTVPEGYLDELRKHLKFSKDDTKFTVTPQPGRGYGIVRCLEKGCQDVVITLSKRPGADDGRKEGIGSLSAYRLHVQEHPTHKTNRFERVKAESKGISTSHSSSASTSTGPHNAFASVNQLASTAPGHPSSSGSKYQKQSVKPEPYDSSVGSSSSPASSLIRSGKRNFIHMDDEDTDITVPSSSPYRPSVVAKKAKLEGSKSESSLAPLGTVDSNAPKSGSASTSLSPQAAHAKLVEVNQIINVTQNLLGHYTKKARKTPSDKTRMMTLEGQLRDHRADKLRYETMLQSSTSAASQASSSAAQLAAKHSSSETDIKPFGVQPFASGFRDHVPPSAPSVASGSNVQLPAAASVPGGILDMQSGVTPCVPTSSLPSYAGIGLPDYGDVGPNYGDTVDVDYDDFYAGRRHIPHRGPVANPGDIEKFLVDAGNSELFDGNESVDKALEKIGLTKLGEQIPKMTIPLMPHQVIGVAWMNEHERGNHKGGILADEMGLGKTVQMIATMLQNRSNDPAVKSTLICAPVALLEQWKLEIETKTDGAFKCLIYHGSNKPKQKSELQKYDVVLTTFQTLALEYDDPRVAERKKSKKKKGKGNSSDDFIETDSENEKKKKLKKMKGLLLRVPWFRVVLDEAQNIRNRNTRISIAVTNIEAKHRWCLTGTPVTNSLADCYGLIRFLEIRPWYDWEEFNGHIARIEKKDPELASRRLQAILNSCLLRRKKDSLLDGKKLIELPPKEVVLQQLVFSQDERDIYNAVEAKSQATFNKYLRAGTVLKNYTQVLVLLLRLRQLCSHPCLIQEDGYAFVRPEDDAVVKYEVQTELDRAKVLAGEEFVKRMKTKLKEVVLQRMAAEKESTEAVIEEEECPICFDSLTNPLITRCGHVFCTDCIDTVLNQPAVGDGNQPRYAMSERPCPTCREPVQKDMLFQRSAFEPSDADLGGSAATSAPIIVDDDDEDDDGLPIGSDVFPEAKRSNATASTKGKGKAKAKKRFSKRLLESDEDDDEDNDISDFIVESDEDEEEKDARRELKKKSGKNRRVVPDSDEDSEMEDGEELLPPKVIAKKKRKAQNLDRFLPSTKMLEMMALLKKWAEAEESRNEKTMVLSQWTTCLDLVAHYLDENGFTFVRYQGNMNRHARDEAVRTFMSQGKARILLMSLKCGGVGLNLTRANRVISLDLGWSSAVESQAFDRVHRLGQARPVTVQRLVVENTVEARILALQERKQNLADGSLGEGTGKKLGRLSVKDLANLFGLNARGQAL